MDVFRAFFQFGEARKVIPGALILRVAHLKQDGAVTLDYKWRVGSEFHIPIFY